MILTALFDLISKVIDKIPFSLPTLPIKFSQTLDFILDNIVNSLGLLDLFFDLKFWLGCATFMFIISNIKHGWNLIVYLLNLIPTVTIPFWK